MESLVGAIVGVFSVWFVGFLIWTAWSERKDRSRTSHEGSRTSVGRRW